MNIAFLIPHGHEVAPIMARPMRVHVSADATSIIARHGLVTEGQLTAVEEETLELDVYGSEHRTAWFARNNPFLTEIQRAKLDERGVIRPGIVLEMDDILVSVLESDLPKRGRLTRQGMVWARDNSWQASAQWHGATVMEARILNRRELGNKVQQNVRHRVFIRLRVEHPLAIGDFLMYPVDKLREAEAIFDADNKMKSGILGVVGDFLDDAQMPRGPDGCVDLIFPAALFHESLPPGKVMSIGKAKQSGGQSVQTRVMGGYSLITQQPLGGKWGFGQEVSVAHVRWLQSRGLTANIGELVSLKSDDLRHRSVLDAKRRAGKLPPESVPAPGMPETLNLVRSELMALGLAVSLQDAERVVAMTVRPAANEDILAFSNGAIRKPETLNYKTLFDIEGGLFCPKVFGSDDHARRQHWGHLELPAPVISPLWRFGSPSVLERLLGFTKKEIDALFNHEIWVSEIDGVWQIVPFSAGSQIKKKGQPPEAETEQFTGAIAVEAMLKTVLPERVPPGLRGRAETLALRAIPVLPPDIRPLVLLDNGNFATSDLNDLYRRLINRSNRLTKLEELKAPPVIVWNERRELQRAADALWANCLVPKRSAVLGDTDRPLVDCLELLFRRLTDEKSKRVDWSARARTVAISGLSDRQLLVPRSVFIELQLEPEQPVLVTAESGDGSFVALLPSPHDHAVFAMAPSVYGKLGLDGRVRHECVLFKPLGVKACAEALRLLESNPGGCVNIPVGKSWIDVTEREHLVSGLVEAAINETRTLFESPRGLLVAGTGCVDLVADSQLPAPPRRVLEIPIPSEQAPLTGAALRMRISEVLEGCRRKTCIFHLTRTDEEPALGVGRVGGLPDLPPDVEWPRNRDRYLPFLAQLPLDEARAAGALPIDVAPGSLLTIFESGGENAASANDVVFVVSTNEKLKRRSPPANVRTYPWCKLESEIGEELPSWEEAVAMLKAEIGPIDPNELLAFRDSEWVRKPSAAEAIKLGGWPAWIQAAESYAPLLAQIVSNEDADMCFVDAGSLYVFAREKGGYEMILQYF